MSEEFAFHIEMETDRLVREEKLSRAEARRRALVAFGGITRHKEELREGRGLAWFSGLSLDMTLGLRMLVKYPGLTIVGGLAMSFAIWVGAVTFEMVGLFVSPTLPLPDGDRIVQVRNWDASANDAELRAVRDFVVWRDALRTITDLGAYRDVTHNLIASADNAGPVAVAEISASAFRIAPAAPVHGRVLTAADERAGAPPVVVLGHDVWQARFAGDPRIVGRSVRLGETFATVVGVMPDGFEFPIAHDAWTPLQVDALDQSPRSGPDITIFGRLAPGASLETAQAELTMLGQRASAGLPDTHRHLRPRVDGYAKLASNPNSTEQPLIRSFNVFALMLVILLSCNVALLLFARAATRENELIVRSALGASRQRIIAQLFVEALVLGGFAALVGLVAAHIALQTWGRNYLEFNIGRLPFWQDPHLSPMTVLYALGLTVIGAAIAGMIPALKVTRGLGSQLRQSSAGSGGLRFGGVWTAVIITQVAFTVAFPAVAFLMQQESMRIRSFDIGFAASEYLAVRLEMDAVDASGANADSLKAAQRTRFGVALETLRQRVAAEPGVTGVTFVDRLPRMGHPERMIELDEPTGAPVPSAVNPPLREVALASIDPSYFEVLQAPILAGRAFNAGDVASEARPVIVDQGFVDQVLVGRNAIGRRFRHSAVGRNGIVSDDPRPWYEIVGVVKDLGMGLMTHRGRAAGVYSPAELGSGPMHLIVHATGDPLALVPRVRAIATAVDPTLRPSEPQRMSEVTNAVLWALGLWLRITLLLTAIALLLSLAGIYAVLSFTVARRTREIGVRVALGASARRVVAAIFRRPMIQVGLGVLAGGVLVGGVAAAMSGGGLAPRHIALLLAYVAVMFGVCLLACIVPTWRALNVEPTVALRAE